MYLHDCSAYMYCHMLWLGADDSRGAGDVSCSFSKGGYCRFNLPDDLYAPWHDERPLCLTFAVCSEPQLTRPETSHLDSVFTSFQISGPDTTRSCFHRPWHSAHRATSLVTPYLGTHSKGACTTSQPKNVSATIQGRGVSSPSGTWCEECDMRLYCTSGHATAGEGSFREC